MVGLPDMSVRESRDRVRSAIRNSGFDFPVHRITVNLAPADVRKAGASFDLPIALGILAAQGIVERRHISDLVLLGELSLDGSIQATRGVLPIAAAARREGLAGILLPAPNAGEAAIVSGLDVVPVSSLAEAVRALNEPATRAASAVAPAPEAPRVIADLADVRGQRLARRALEIASAGGHNLLLVGPPGAGKTMMARRVGGILPPLTFDEALEVTSVHSVAGLLPSGAGLLAARPFRAPHHTISGVALVGGGSQPRGIGRRSAMPMTVYAPMPSSLRRACLASATWIATPFACSTARLRASRSARGHTIGFARWRALSRTSMSPRQSAGTTSRRR